MKILLAPSETKKEGGIGKLDLNSLFLPEINSVREDLLEKYNNIVLNTNLEELSKLFGLKKESDIRKYIKDIFNEPLLEAIKRYTGVAYDYLDYNSLDDDSKEYLHKNLLIFSNLFGVVKANDKIPNYRLKQGSQISDMKVEKIYKEALKDPMDRYLENEDILDIRASFYDKYYKVSKTYTTLKFLKKGKVVSHWAKAYRGMILRYCAINKIENINDFMKMEIENLAILEIKEQGKKQEIIYEILD